MNVPINIPDIDEQEIREVTSVLSEKALTSASFEGGKRVRQFEDLLSNFVKSKFAIAVNSGTSALQASLYALDIKPNDEVLIPSFTFVATANSVKSIGAKPVFVDILKDNFTMDPDDMKKKITKRTKAIIPVHLYGHVAYMEEIMEKTLIKVLMDKEQLDIIARIVAYMYHDKKDEFEEIASEMQKEHIYKDLRSIDLWLNSQYKRLESENEQSKQKKRKRL